ncbi:MAG: hypothetical protein CTY31_03635 [Hyphomicrobium sp.]|nr:MAG: hypothetical protein CTY31_03635 [Hyphomicrobium sp.]
MADVRNERMERESLVNPYSLLEAVNSASATVNTAWLIFIAIMAYVLIAVAGVTHKDLLLETPVALPIMQVSIPLRQFFTFIPIVLVLFHLGVVAQLVLLARKTIEFHHAVRLLESSDQRMHPLRLELHNFFFVQAIAGPDRSRVISAFLHGMSWLTTMIFPVLLLLYIQVSFLPVHDVTTAWVHRLALVFDLFVLFLIGTFLLRAESSFFEAMTLNARAHPVNVAFTSAVMFFVAFVSFFVATVPDERLDRTARVLFGAPEPKLGQDTTVIDGGYAFPMLASADTGWLFGMFPRNLLVTDADLVIDRDVEPGEATLNLRGRDLRYARLDRSDLHQGDLTGADLSHASLVGADLRGISLTCSDLNSAADGKSRGSVGCAMARQANFSQARLDSAELSGADMTEARFQDASLGSARLVRATLTAAQFDGAHLNGADLDGALLQGADFEAADLRAANLSLARLEGAVLRRATLEGANLFRATLWGADLTTAIITAADFRGAYVWMTPPPSADPLSLGDLRDLQMRAPNADELAGLQSVLDAHKGDGDLRQSLTASLEPLMSKTASVAWESGDANSPISIWRQLAYAPTVSEESQRQRSSEYLVSMMCTARGASAQHIATGIARRAQASEFAGDAVAISDATLRESCAPAKSIAEDVMAGLARAVDRVRAVAPQVSVPQYTPPPAPVATPVVPIPDQPVPQP